MIYYLQEEKQILVQDHQLREPGLKIDFSDPECVGLMLGSVSFSKTAQNVNNEIGNEKCLCKGRCCGLRRSLQRKNKDKNKENQTAGDSTPAECRK